ncbi:M24 family metallopeptidase [Candidatus Bipolaricaulota bacterium]|nr:M24 family metallopeptidase [Candidatus Bipolaricaulota bacterium]
MNRHAMEKLHAWMEERGFPHFTVLRPENFAWLTGGGDNTVVAGEGVAWLEVVEGKVKLHTSRIEEGRLVAEEVTGIDEVVAYPWYAVPEPGRPSDLEHDLTPLRLALSPEEQERFRALGRDAAQALGEVVRAARPQWTERELAGEVAAALYARGIQPVVLLVAGEERIFKWRHPLPKDRPLGRLFMAVICGRREGLIANLTRLRSFGHPEAEGLYNKVLLVEAAALDATRPGATLGEVLSAIQGAYRAIGRPEAFEEHHQGGIAGYRPREVLATPGDGTRLDVGMAVAWNPSLPGAKAEDTFLITRDGLENLTFDPNWPTVEVEGRRRPDLLLS